MCKKFLLVAFLAIVGVAGVYACNHLNIKLSPKDESPEAQIRRERERLPELDAEIRKYISLVAAREVEVKNLEKDLVGLRKQVADLEKTVTTKAVELRSSATQVKEETRPPHERSRALKELNRQADTLSRLKAELKAKEDQFDAEKEALDAAHEELVAYQNEKRGLETELSQLDAKLAHMRVDEIKARTHFDKSALAERSQRIEALRQQIEVREKERELRVRYLGTGESTTPSVNEKDVFEKVDKLTGRK